MNIVNTAMLPEANNRILAKMPKYKLFTSWLPKNYKSTTVIFPKIPAYRVTPARTHSIRGLKSRVLKLTFLALKMIMKSGLEFIL